MAKLYTKNTWQDEILAGDERYDVKADNGDPIESNVQIVLATGVIQEGTAVTAARMNNIEDGLDAVDTRASELHDAMTALLTGWIPSSGWTYASPTSFIIAGDQRQLFPAGTKIKLVQSGITKYFYAINASYSAPNTTVTITGGSDYTLANAAISEAHYSYMIRPQGFPNIFSYTPTWSATTTSPSLGNGSLNGRYIVQGRACTVFVRLVFGSATSQGAGTWTFSVPIPTVPVGMVYVGPGYVSRPGGVRKIITASMGGSTEFACALHDGVNVGGGAPWQWQASDELNVSITYPV